MKNSPDTLKKRNALRAAWKANTPIDSFLKTKKRKCKTCGKVKPCKWTSSFTQTGKPEYRTQCASCFSAYLTGIRKKSRPKISKQHKIRMKQGKQKAVEYLGGSCVNCGYCKSLAALTFHHKNPKEKEGTVGQMLDWSWDKLRKELDKCDLMCFNCHMELHESEALGNESDL